MPRYILGWLAIATLSCVDTESETASYASPCASVFGDLLLCGREGGGADVRATPGDGPYTCEDACAQLIMCMGGGDPADLAECVAECTQEVTPGQLDCLQAAGCDFERIQACFGGPQ